MINEIKNKMKKRKERKNSFINCSEAFNISALVGSSYKTSINKINVIVGGLPVVYGGLTILLPTGSIFAIMGDLSLMACPVSISKLTKRLYNDVKFWVGVRL